ncbi:hypothetical protein EV356DRAFT_533666 [Viridothelium virens]|uniref:Uncharacterized protein n=1 Tax=Viridothelium virens TaxID=1048519 RepID=A0A6A6H6W5_VIRVR|nr:hypothetical protein EV356DRAFT_533666 [Viridothelium virens]
MNAERQEDEPFIPAEHITKEEATQRRPREPQQKTWWTFIKTHVAVHCIVIGIYTVTAVLIVRYHIKSCARPSAFDNLIFRYTDTTFHNLSQSPYTGPPSQENEAAWENLLAPMHMRVSTEELRRANQESVNLPEGGGYLGWMGVFHELHCIKMLREAHYNARPSESLTVESKKHWESHLEHCFEMLRQSSVCHADTSLTTFKWHPQKTRPMFNASESVHKCVNWDVLMASAAGRVVEEDEILQLQNPLMHAN